MGYAQRAGRQLPAAAQKLGNIRGSVMEMEAFIKDILGALSVATLAEAAAALLFIGAVYIGACLVFGG